MREKRAIMAESPPERCDVKVWSGECRHDDVAAGNEYLCSLCGTINSLDHEMRHEVFPYVSGDTDNLS